jgi:hypothetical protein
MDPAMCLQPKKQSAYTNISYNDYAAAVDLGSPSADINSQSKVDPEHVDTGVLEPFDPQQVDLSTRLHSQPSIKTDEPIHDQLKSSP